MPAADDPALETLLLPFLDERLALASRRRAVPACARRLGRCSDGSLPGLVCEQTFKPDADALLRAGAKRCCGASSGNYPLVLVRRRGSASEARALMARAVVSERGGRVVACMSNNEGARSRRSGSGRGSPVRWKPDEEQVPRLLDGAARWRGRSGARARMARARCGAADRGWTLRQSSGRIRLGPHRSGFGAACRALAADLSGRAADLGAGFGYLSAELLARCPGITALDLYEAEARALDLARRNLATRSRGRRSTSTGTT